MVMKNVLCHYVRKWQVLANPVTFVAERNKNHVLQNHHLLFKNYEHEVILSNM